MWETEEGLPRKVGKGAVIPVLTPRGQEAGRTFVAAQQGAETGKASGAACKWPVLTLSLSTLKLPMGLEWKGEEVRPGAE